MPRGRKKKIVEGAQPTVPPVNEEEGELTVDVFQTPAEIVVQTAVAGVKAEDLDLAIAEDSVTIRGRRDREEGVEADAFLCKECFWGPFARKVELPHRVDANAAQATLKNNGVLTIHLPKIEVSKHKDIKPAEEA